ncbi:peptidase associated/transthyretin-like domain-containing protein [Adhaeribacter pallidiroseus]|uniref:Uncharacterized protein n=1 Tax=Adhaeribacter pallidiroseus TaxID=2072847 RepID=A0A369QI20_9BACT|nr:hypothetical protein [Adhaeribacter pallidiroseus]RDC62876.1 hypothetical protein AHMF7616_01475 [Adhaeribacter pallidiroseus]
MANEQTPLATKPQVTKPDLWRDWESGREFKKLFFILVGLYVFLHLLLPGEELKELSDQEKENIRTMISQAREFCIENGSSIQKPDPKTGADSTAARQKIAQINCPALVSCGDSIATRIVNYISSRYKFNQEHQSVTSWIRAVPEWLRSWFAGSEEVPKSNAITSSTSRDFWQVVLFVREYARSGFPDSFLKDYKLRVHSFFWLTEDLVFLEIIFWSLFGLLASIFYNVSESLREKNDPAKQYDSSIEYVNWAKLFYAPLTTIVIYFSVQLVTTDNLEANFNNLRHGLIILCFVLGFFSGRTVELLERFKNLILPLNKAVDDPNKLSQKDTSLIAPVINGKVTFSPTIDPAPNDQLPSTIINVSSADGKISLKTVPDATGNFSIPVPPEGLYTVSALLTVGAQSYTSKQDITIKNGEDLKIILEASAR